MIYLFTDLDDSLLQSSGKCPISKEHCKPVSIKENNEVQGYSTPAQQQLLDMLSNNGVVIPVTGRTSNAFERVQLEFKSYKALSHGGIVLAPNGAIDPDWKSYLDSETHKYQSQFSLLIDLVDSLIEELGIKPTNYGIKEQYGYPCYFNFKVDSKDTSKVKIVYKKMSEFVKSNDAYTEFTIHSNDRTFDILPPYTSKAKAVDFIYKKLEISDKDLVLGLGDSISDLPFMKKCDFLMVPQNSQITKQKL